MIEIKPQKIKDAAVSVPGSKSYTHRILIAAALSNGDCTIQNALQSEDTLLTLNALKQMGVQIEQDQQQLAVRGSSGVLAACSEPIFLGNSGTSMRLLTAVAALGNGTYRLQGTERMGQRPIQDLLDGLTQIGVRAVSINGNGCPPVDVDGGRVKGGRLSLNCETSSQFLSALLLIAPYTQEGLDIRIVGGLVSKPYVDMTVEVMQRLGLQVARDGYERFQIAGDQVYQAGSYAVEPDCSQAGYFWGAAAITGAAVTVEGVRADTRQGDVRFARVLEAMGCRVDDYDGQGITVRGGVLKGIEADMADMPDMVPTLAVVAAFAAGTTVIKNVPHLKAKESDRLGSVVAELSKLGIAASCNDSGMTVRGGPMHGAEIDTYGDHRLAMSFAMAGLAVPGIVIKDERCVEKSFPTFWQVFAQLYGA